ncbi:MAG: hypothetical protein SPF22_03480 [Candidatus Onthovivens sp.]|nr:hypothetical protein [Candidatus Onthovivens sp.]
MTSKEYLQQIATTEVIDCTYNDNSKKRIADIFSVGIAVIENDLEVLEILKRVFNYKSVQKFVEDTSADEFFILKEWLNNDSNKRIH